MTGAVNRPITTSAAQAAVLGGVYARAALKWASHGTAR